MAALGARLHAGACQGRLVPLRALSLPTRWLTGGCGGWYASRTHRETGRAAGGRLPTRRVAARCLASASVEDGCQLQELGLHIRPGEVHIWWLQPSKVESPAALERYSRLLSADELRDCRSSDSPAVVRERLLARAFVRAVLAQYAAGCPPPESLAFDRNQHGKPSLVWPSHTAAGHRLHFNLTHTSSLIGLAVAAEALVGLDVEELVRKARDPMRLARRRFAEQEIADLQDMPEGAARDSCFIQLWTLKEAYVKALGRGISAPPGLRSFAFRLACAGAQAQQQQGKQEEQQQGREGEQRATSAGRGSECEQWDENSAAAQCSTEEAGLAPGTPVGFERREAAAGAHAQARAWQNGSSLGSGSGGSSECSCNSSSSSSSSGLSSIDLQRSSEALAHESRRWECLLLRPSPRHVAALCVERLEDAEGTERGGRGSGAVQVLAFEGMPLEGHAPVEMEVLARGGSA